jgi:hypothetical protein
VITDTAGTAPVHAPVDLTPLRQMVMGFRLTQAVHVAARLGLADALHERPASADDLAPQVGADPAALARLLRALASVGLFAAAADGTWRTTPLGDGLRRDAPGSVHALACLYGEEWLWSAYGRMLHSACTGEPGFDDVHGQPLYAYLDGHPDAAATFHAAMSGFSAQEQAAILAAYDFSNTATIVDVGGGEGALLAAILDAHPRVQGLLFDLAPAAVHARTRSRMGVVVGDFFTHVTAGGDLYVLKSVLHNWPDDRAVTILSNCREAMAGGGRVLVAERVVTDDGGPAEAALFDLNMLVVAGGRERTAAEYRELFAAAGLAVTRVVPTASPLSLVEGARAN